MDIRIFARNIELNPDAERYIQKKFSRIERHLRPISDAKLEVSRTSARSQADRIVAQMTVTANGYTLRGQESGQNLFAAIDAVTDVLDRQIQRFKGKVYRSEQSRRSARTGPAAESDSLAAEEPEEGVANELGKVVRTKRFQMTPMTVEDAITQMELLDHDFFLFFNIDKSEYNVVYRRQDGDYGVIEPELV
jgi:putative sigma-54 modulation protein